MNNYREDFKLREERRRGLVNLILNYAIENSMSLKEVDKCVEIAKEAYYSDAVIKRPAPEGPVQEQSISSCLKGKIRIDGLEVFKNINSDNILILESKSTGRSSIEVNISKL